jgi:hypothetical protein
MFKPVFQTTIFVLVFFNISVVKGQVNIDSVPKTTLRKLPYEKNKKQDYISLNISGGVAVETTNFDNTYLISLTPRLHNYLSKRWENVFDYTFIFQKLGSLANNEVNSFHQISSSLRYFLSEKINIVYLESGLQFGNYALKNDNNGDSYSLKKWNTCLIVGLGLELLPRRRKRIFDFDVRIAIPLSNGLEIDLIRSIGFGTRIKL